MQNLSKRLTQIAVLVPTKCRVADIGTDHGYLPIYLIKNNIALSVLACDISEKPLQSAKRNLEASGLHNVDVRLSDGFENIHPEEIDTAVIAGIGGEVIANIIDKCSWIKSNKYTLILQPTTSPEKLRKYLADNAFLVEDEIAVYENSKIYSIMKVKFCGEKQLLSPCELYSGRLKPDSVDNIKYIKKQLSRIHALLEDLKTVDKKQKEYFYFSEIEKNLTKLLGGTNGA